MLKQFKRLNQYLLQYDFESLKFMEFVSASIADRDARILDVGCGYGRYLKLLTDKGLNVVGVEENESIVKHNQSAGLNCVTVKEFTETDDQFDLIIMSHIIEHFPPCELKDFLDSYLDRLKVGGNLIIATPLMSSYFYDDFDHIKPYQPVGIMMVFGEGDAQVQYYARNKLELKDIWFRKSFYRLSYIRGKYISGNFVSRVLQFFHFCSALISCLSRGSIGKVDGWVGVFEKKDR